MPIIIHLATTADAEIIATISQQTFYDTFAAVNSKEDMDLFLAEQFNLKDLIAEVGQKDNYFFLAYIDNRLAGYARMRESVNHAAFYNKPAIEIARLYAVTEMIGQGIGKALMEHCVDVAKQMGKNIIWLGVWEKNDRAISFYQKFGFEKFGEHNFILGTDLQTDWEMMKIL